MDKCISVVIQNEILKTMVLHILQQVADCLFSSILATMVNETTDVSNKEKVVLCYSWVDGNLEAHEDFVGLSESTVVLSM